MQPVINNRAQYRLDSKRNTILIGKRKQMNG
jgi:hypothetical protein